MAVFIRGNTVGIGGIAQNVGVFVGQNIQDGWDANSPEKYASNMNMGDGNLNMSVMSYYFGVARHWQNTYDADFKGNFELRRMR